MPAGFQSRLRSIVPNIDPNTYLLRIFADYVERLPIIAWSVHLETCTPIKGEPFDTTTVLPVSIEEAPSNCIECIAIPGGRVYRTDDRSWDSTHAAIKECQSELCEPTA